MVCVDGYFASGTPETQITITVYIIYMMSNIIIPTDGERSFICALMMFFLLMAGQDKHS